MGLLLAVLKLFAAVSILALAYYASAVVYMAGWRWLRSIKSKRHQKRDPGLTINFKDNEPR